MAANDQVGISNALQQIESALAEEFTEESLRPAAAQAGERVNVNHRRLFFPALAAAVGVRIVGSDAPGASGSDVGTTLGGALNVAPSGGGGLVPPIVKPRVRGRGTIMASLNAQPEIFAEEFAATNAKLIASLSPDIVPALRDEIVREVLNGEGNAERAAARLLAKWEKQGVPILVRNSAATQKGIPGFTSNVQSRVNFIVRDQVSKLNSQITQARQVAAGIEQFKWVTVGDDRVRPLHRQINGRVYSWDVGHPTEGFPGQPPNCRCHAEAVVDRDTVLRSPGWIELARTEVEFDV